jgi:hypothetical protein
MANKSWATRYDPPSVELFRNNSTGLHGMAFMGVQYLEVGLGHLESWLNAIDSGDWTEEAGMAAENRKFLAEDLVDMYGDWAFTIDCIQRLEDMPSTDREKFAALSPHVKLQDIEARYVKASGVLAALELRHPLVYQRELDRQIFERLDKWEACLKKVASSEKGEPEDDSLYANELDEDAPRKPGDEYVTWGDFFSGRNDFQWLLIAIYKLRYLTMEDEDAGCELRLRLISPFEIEERLEETDKLLRKVLRGRKDSSTFWLDDATFWWCENWRTKGKQS